MLKWIVRFLVSKTQNVVKRDVCLSSESVKSAVLLDTALGPLLFIIYINDTNNKHRWHHIQHETLPYDSEHLKIVYRSGDRSNLQSDEGIGLPSNWETTLLLRNENKFKLIHFSKEAAFQLPYTILSD